MRSKDLANKLVCLDEVCKRLKQGHFDTGDSTYWGQTRKDLQEQKGLLESSIREDLELREWDPEILIGMAIEGKFCPTLAERLRSG